MPVPALASASNTMLNRRKESGRPHLHPSLGVKALISLSPLSIKLTVGLVFCFCFFVSTLYQDEEIPY